MSVVSINAFLQCLRLKFDCLWACIRTVLLYNCTDGEQYLSRKKIFKTFFSFCSPPFRGEGMLLSIYSLNVI